MLDWSLLAGPGPPQVLVGWVVEGPRGEGWAPLVEGWAPLGVAGAPRHGPPGGGGGGAGGPGGGEGHLGERSNFTISGP